MKTIPDNSIDMVLCDLPYGTTACKWDNVIPFEPLWEQYERIIKDNGAIIILATKDRKVRIEVGHGLEGDITDSQAGQILDNYMIPSLKNNDWDTAVINGVHALEKQLTK
jgi:uncharacterized membrane protein YgcG